MTLTDNSYYRLEVQVGQVWVPAHLGVVSRARGEQLLAAYKIDRPSAVLRLSPERNGGEG